MGWSSNQNWTRKVEVIRDIKFEYRDKAKEFKEVKDGVWVLTKTGKIHFVLIEKRDGQWWEKSLSADCCPFYYDVPARWIKEWTPTTEDGVHWLEQVRKHQAKSKRDLVGANVLYQGRFWNVESHPSIGGKYKLKSNAYEMDVTKNALRKSGVVL
jgi:hypothetical protein